MRLFLVILLASASPVWAHKTATGWTYSGDCCNDKDCHVIPISAVKITPQNYIFSITPADHHILQKAKTFIVPVTDPKILPSGDDDFHLCISPIVYEYYSGEPSGNNLLCIYVPTGGV